MGKVKFGLSNVHYAIVTETTDASTGEVTSTYGTVKAWPGAVSINMDPQGDNTPFHADNGVYYTTDTNNGYAGDFESAEVPEDVETGVYGQTKDATSGMVVEKADDVKKYIALLFEFDGDPSKRRFCFYRCRLQRHSIASQTTSDTTTVGTDTVNIAATPRPDDKVVKSFADESAAAYANWYNAVPAVA